MFAKRPKSMVSPAISGDLEGLLMTHINISKLRIFMFACETVHGLIDVC